MSYLIILIVNNTTIKI